MAIVLNQFAEDSILTAAQLNALVNGITAKFNSGITTGDLASPLRLPGNLDMNSFEILHLARLWNVRNLAERSISTSLQAVLTEVGAAGGGVVLLPADTTEIVGTGGVTVEANTVIMGHGDTSLFTMSGTATDHMFRSATPGATGIMFVNLRIFGPGTGAFNTINMQRTVRAKFINVWMTVSQESGIALVTDSAGSSCKDTLIDDCQFELISSGDAGVFFSDVQRLRINRCTFNVGIANGVGIEGVAAGATSNMEKVFIDAGNVFNHTAGAAEISIQITAGTTNGIDQMQINDNHFDGVSTTNDFFIDINGGTSSVASHVQINDNSIKSGAADDAAIRVRNLNKFGIHGNEVNVTGTAIGILIGADARAGTAAGCTDYSITHNDVHAAGSAYVFCHNGTTSMGAVIQGNRGATTSATVAEFEIWNLLADPTALTFDAMIQGNMADEGSPSVASWRNYTDRGVTQGGEAGVALNSNLLVLGNSMTGAVFADGAGNQDFHQTSNDATLRYIQNNNIF